MLGWFYRVIVGSFHQHKWTIIDQYNIRTKGYTNPTGQGYIQKCDVCGEIKQKLFYT